MLVWSPYMFGALILIKLYSSPQELSLGPSGSSFSDDEYFFTLALRSLVNSAHHTRTSLPRDFFLRRENQIVYDEASSS